MCEGGSRASGKQARWRAETGNGLLVRSVSIPKWSDDVQTQRPNLRRCIVHDKHLEQAIGLRARETRFELIACIAIDTASLRANSSNALHLLPRRRLWLLLRITR